MGNLIASDLGAHASGNEIKRRQPEHVGAMALLDEQKQELKANLAVMRCLDGHIDALERSIRARANCATTTKRSRRSTVSVSQALALTIALETGAKCAMSSAEGNTGFGTKECAMRTQ